MRALAIMNRLRRNYIISREYDLASIIQAVIELHKPSRDVGESYCISCTGVAMNWVEYPCPTIMAVRENL